MPKTRLKKRRKLAKRKKNPLEPAPSRINSDKKYKAEVAEKEGENSLDWKTFVRTHGETPIDYLDFVLSEQARLDAIDALETSLWAPHIEYEGEEKPTEYIPATVYRESIEWIKFKKKYNVDPTEFLEFEYPEDYALFIQSKAEKEDRPRYKNINSVFKTSLAIRAILFPTIEDLYSRVYDDDPLVHVNKFDPKNLIYYVYNELRGYMSWVPGMNVEKGPKIESIHIPHKIKSYSQLVSFFLDNSGGTYDYPVKVTWEYNHLTQVLFLVVNDNTYIIAEPIIGAEVDNDFNVIRKTGFLKAYYDLFKEKEYEELLFRLIEDNHYDLFGKNYLGDTKIDVYVVKATTFDDRIRRTYVAGKTPARESAESAIASSVLGERESDIQEESGPYYRRVKKISHLIKEGAQEEVEQAARRLRFEKEEITKEQLERIGISKFGETARLVSKTIITSFLESVKEINAVEEVQEVYDDELIPIDNYDALYWVIVLVMMEVVYRYTNFNVTIDILNRQFILPGWDKRLYHGTRQEGKPSIVEYIESEAKGGKTLLGLLPKFWQDIALSISVMMDYSNPKLSEISINDVISYFIDLANRTYIGIDKWAKSSVKLVLEKTIETNNERFIETAEKMAQKIETKERRRVDLSETVDVLKKEIRPNVKEKFFDELRIISDEFANQALAIVENIEDVYHAKA